MVSLLFATELGAETDRSSLSLLIVMFFELASSSSLGSSTPAQQALLSSETDSFEDATAGDFTRSSNSMGGSGEGVLLIVLLLV